MQGQSGVLYFQPKTATPFEMECHAAHLERQRRFEVAARGVVDQLKSAAAALEIQTREYAPPVAVEPTPETPRQWAERQVKLHREKPWFSMLGEIGSDPKEPREPVNPSVSQIQYAVADHYDVTRPDMLSKRRTKDIVRPRQVAMYLSKMLTGRSLPDIGRRFGNRDHTTALHAVRKIDGLRSRDADLDDDIIAICAKLQAASRNTAAMPVE